MKNNSFLRNIKHLTVGTIIVICVNNSHGATLAVDQYPTTDYSTVSSWTGTLTHVASQQAGQHIGFYGVTINLVLDSATEDDSCCYLPPLSFGRKIKIKDADVKLKFTITNSKMTLPVWTERGSSTCASASNEWTRFSDAVYQHEAGHESIAKAFLIQSTLDTYISGKDFSAESICRSSSTSASAEAKNQIKAKLPPIMKDIKDEYDSRQAQFHQTNGPINLDPTKECTP